MYNNISAEKCFSNSNDSNKSSCDYTKKIKQKTIYNNIVKQVQSQTNFIKSNGVNYNQNFGLHNNCLAFAKSYDLLLDVTKGKYYSQSVEDPAWTSNEAWSAGLYSVNYSANGVNAVVDTSYNAGNANQDIFPMTQSAELADISWNGIYPGVRIDPSYNIFYNECENQNYWRDKLVDMSFNTTNYSIKSKQQSEQLYGMAYPANVSFNCGNEKKCGVIDISTIAINTGGNNWSVVGNKTIELCQILNIDIGVILIINPGITLTVEGTLNNKGTINNNGTIINNGEITNDASGTITNNNIFTNSLGGTLTNNGTITNNLEFNNIGIVENTSVIINHGTFSNNAGGQMNNRVIGQLNNNSDGTFTNNGTITNYNFVAIINAGVFNNNLLGEIINNDNGQIYNNLLATITNNGTITNNNSGQINNNFTSQINNSGTITNNNSGQINNKQFGIITNNNSGTITNNNRGTITNNGTIDNNAAIDNTGTGVFEPARINNLGPGIINIKSGGNINNNSFGLITNVNKININSGGQINNNSGSIFTNEIPGRIDNGGGVITNRGTFNINFGATIYNYASGFINNLGTFFRGGSLINSLGLPCGAGTLFGISASSTGCPPP